MPFSSSKLCASIAISLAVCLTSASAIADPDGDSLSSLNTQVESLYNAKKYVDAVPLAQRVVALSEKQYGAESAELGLGLQRLGVLYYQQNRMAEAEPVFKRALAIREKALGDDPDVATTIDFLSWIDFGQRRYAEAEPLLRRALEIREKKLGSDSLDVARTLEGLGWTLGNIGQYEEAVRLYNRSLTIREKRAGPDDLSVAGTLHDLAGVYGTQGRFSETLPLYQRELAIREKASKPDDLPLAGTYYNLGWVYGTLGRFADAQPLLERALAIREKVLGPDHLDVAMTLAGLANSYRTEKRFDEAKTALNRALAIREKVLGHDDPLVAATLSDLGLVFWNQGRYAEAQPLYERSLAIREKALGSDDVVVATALQDLAWIHAKQNHNDQAETLFKRSLAIKEKKLGEQHLEVAATATALGSLYMQLARYHDAESYNKRALDIVEKAFGPDHPNVAVALHNLGWAYAAENKFPEAQVVFQRSLAIDEKTLGPNHPNVAGVLTGIARVYGNEGRYDEAEPLDQRALAIREKLSGSDDLEVAYVLRELAWLNTNRHLNAKAKDYYSRALSISEKKLGANDPGVAIDLQTLASRYWSDGQYSEAEQLDQRALSIRESALGPNHPDVANSLLDVAQIYHDESRFTEARPLLERSVAILQKAKGSDDPQAGAVAVVLADIYRHLGRYGEAQHLLEHWIPILEKSKSSGDLGNALDDLGDVFRNQGRYAEAEPLYKRFLELNEKIDPKGEAVSTALNDLAWLYFEKADWAKAADLWQRSATITVDLARSGDQNARNEKSKGEAEIEGFRFSSLVKAEYMQNSETPAALSSAANDMFVNAQWAMSSAASSALTQMAVRGAAANAELASLVRERQDLMNEREAKSGLLLTAHSEPPDRRVPEGEQELADRLAAIDSRAAEIDTALKSSFSQYTALSNPEPESIKDIQSVLRGDEAFLLLFSTPELKPRPEETFIWAITKSDVRLVRSDLGPKALQDYVVALRCGLDATAWRDAGSKRCSTLLKLGPQAAPPRSLPFDLAKSFALYKGLFGELDALIEDKQLLIVSNGPLTSLPFHVLVTSPPTGNGLTSASWLIRTHALTVLPSVASLGSLRHSAKASQAPEPFIGFGNPVLKRSCGSVYIPLKCPGEEIEIAAAEDNTARSGDDVGTADHYFRGGLADVAALKTRLCPLPDTEYELSCVAKSLHAPENSVIIGKDMTEGALKKTPLDRYRVVHFATHGLLAGETAQFTKTHVEPALVFSPPDTPTDDDDGLLTASEVAGLKLDADWVVMSACNTAAGAEPGAEALSGLAKAFFYAGARALLVSHWPVNSYAATMLTSTTFAEIEKHPEVGRSEAFRRAMLALLSDPARPWAAHPSVWAPFVVVGEGGATH